MASHGHGDTTTQQASSCPTAALHPGMLAPMRSRRRRITDHTTAVPAPRPAPAPHAAEPDDQVPAEAADEDPTPPRPMPNCCQARRERRLNGGTIVELTTHHTDCPVWTAR